MPTSQQQALVIPPVGNNNIMATVQMLWGPGSIGQVNAVTTALGSISLNDADNAAGWIFAVPRDGIVTDVGLYVATETGTSPAYNVGIVTLDSSGRPSTSAYGGSAVTSAQWTSTGLKWVTLSIPATVAAGDFVATHVYPSGSTPDGSNFIAVPNVGITLGRGLNANFTVAWAVTTTSGAAGFAVRYDDGTVYGFALSSNTVHVQIRSNTTPDEVGDLFYLPAAMTCYGARVFHAASGLGASTTLDVVLYSAADAVLASATVDDRDKIKDGFFDVYWDGVNLAAGTYYRLVVKPTTAASGDVYLPKWTFESAAALASLPEGARWQYTSRVDAGAWDDSETTAVCPLGLWISAVEFTSEYGFSG